MNIEEVKRNLNKMVVYQGKENIYMLTACTLRKNEQGYYYQAEIRDTKNRNSIMLVKLTDVEEAK